MYVQQITCTQSQITIVTVQGQSTQFQAVKDFIPGDHPITIPIVNNIAEILLGLFIPWEAMSPLSQ